MRTKMCTIEFIIKMENGYDKRITYTNKSKSS